VLLPGKIVSTNAHKKENGKAAWKFSLTDFSDGFSTYTLKAISRSLRVSGLILFIAAGIIGFSFVVFILIGVRKYREKEKPKGRKKKPSK